MSTALAFSLIEGLLSLGINVLVQTQRYQTMVLTAAREGRDISDEELSGLQAESKKALADLEALIQGATNDEAPTTQ